MNTIDGIIFINLEHRKDRLENIIQQLYHSPVAKQTPIPPEKIQRLDAVYNQKCGAAGCGASHVKALSIAIDKGWNRVAIFEDDFAWKDNTKYIVSCLQQIDTLKVDWNVLFLSTSRTCLKIIEKLPNNLIKVQNAQTTSGYIVNGIEYMKKLRGLFLVCVEQLEKGAQLREWSIDMKWKSLQKDGKWYSFKENLGRQIVSYSDVSKCVLKRHKNTF